MSFFLLLTESAGSVNAVQNVMRWCVMIIALGLFTQAIADPVPDPEPKKYKPESKEKSTKITEEEKAFLRDVEAKYGVKIEKPAQEEGKTAIKENKEINDLPKPFPAVIAIEIVNDTNTDGKGKRTIDANLGYGYRTNNGYSYSYFGKPKQEQGKFMIYPYSQEDIPPPRPTHSAFGHHQRHQPQYHQQSSKLSHSKYSINSPNVEIQPSRAYELVPVTEAPSTYNSYEPISELKTKYERVKSLETPPPPSHSEQANHKVPSTLFTTYNGGQLSGLTGQFPSVMSNYFVDSSQLLQNPQFQSVGLTSDHLRQHGPTQDQQVVPVLVLRIPSSHLRNPSADLYPNLPSNYPLSQYLNNVNLQDLVSQYFKKIGYPQIPQVMTHYTPLSNAEIAHAEAPMVQYTAPETQQQYEVPATSSQQYLPPVASSQQYSSPAAVAHQYETPDSTAQQYSSPAVPTHYTAAEARAPQYQPQYYAAPEPQPRYTQVDFSGVQYSAVQPVMAKYPIMSSMLHSGQQFVIQNPHTQQVYQYVQPAQSDFRQYLQADYQQPHYQQPQYEFQYEEAALPPAQEEYQRPAHTSVEYESQKQSLAPKGHVSYGPPTDAQEHPTQSEASQDQYQDAIVTNADTYTSPRPEPQQEQKHIPISENYPSKDHTQVTVIPHSYQSSESKKHKSNFQTVSYVTPSPRGTKYHSFKTMAPQSVLGVERGVSYINSHSIPANTYRASYNQEVQSYSNPEHEQPTELTHVPPVGSQKAPSYPRNYHSYSGQHKRMVTPKVENKSRSQAVKKIESNEKRPSP